MAYGDSNGHVIDDVTWPCKGHVTTQGSTPNTLSVFIRELHSWKRCYFRKCERSTQRCSGHLGLCRLAAS